MLSREERARAQRRLDPGGRDKYVAARSGLRERLALYTGQSPESLDFEVSEFGKPRLRQHASLQFNLAYSAEMAALAVSEGAPVGVDLEQIAATDLDVARSYFTEGEFFLVASARPGEQRSLFFSLWTLKEALVKAVGTGLSTPLDSFEVSLDPPRLTACPRDWGDPAHWQLRLSVLSGGFACALAVRTGSDIEVVEHGSRSVPVESQS